MLDMGAQGGSRAHPVLALSWGQLRTGQCAMSFDSVGAVNEETGLTNWEAGRASWRRKSRVFV